MSAETNAKMLAYTKVSGRALHLYGQLLDQNQKKEAAARAAVPQVVELLKRAKLIGSEHVKLAETQLSDHAQALEVLGNVLNELETRVKAAEAAPAASDRLGKAEPATSPRAKIASTDSPFVGRRAGDGEIRESDKPFLRLAGVNI